MAEIIPFPGGADAPAPTRMNRGQLNELLAHIRTQIDQLNEEEPEDMNSPEYELWGELHEKLEDWEDDILDLLDEAED